MGALTRVFVWTAAVAVVEMHAGDQSIGIQYNIRPSPVELPPGEAFLERYKVAFNRRLEDQFADRLHPFNVMNWSVDLADRDYDQFQERISSAARNAISKSVGYGFREAAVDLPIMLWLEDRQDFLADFLRNSVGNVGEEQVAPLDVSYRLAERSWWKRLSENEDVRFGIRPFRTSPYTFLSWGIRDGDTLLLLAHVRYHYRNLADHRFEIALSLPLPHGLAIDIGTSYQFGRNRDEERLVIKLEKEFKSGGIVHVGFEAREGAAVFAGLAFPW
jgi:hypothetical protein